MSVNYIGAFYTKLFHLLKVDDGLTIGQKLDLIETATRGVGLRNIDDKSLYEVLEKLLLEDISDEPLTDEEFNQWMESKCQ